MITLQEIAQRAGVTQMTTSRVLNGSYKAKRPQAIKRAQLIRRLAEDLGYRPNTAAQATATGRFNCACIVSSTHGSRSTLFPGLIRGAHDALAKRNMHLTLAHVNDERLTDSQFVPKALREWMADGLLINYTQEIPQALIDLVRRHRIPSVWVNSIQESDCVFFDDLGGGKQLCQHLLSLGHRRIAFVHYGRESHYSTSARCRGYEQAMREADLQPRIIRRQFAHPRIDDPGETTVPLSMAWLQEADRPTAIITYSHTEATSARIAAAELGLRLPEQLSIATFAESLDEGMGQRVARMWSSHGELAHAGVEMLIEKIDEPARLIPPRSITMRFWEGASCLPVNRSEGSTKG